MKELNEIESVDAFEIMDIEEKLDFVKWTASGTIKVDKDGNVSGSATISGSF